MAARVAVLVEKDGLGLVAEVELPPLYQLMVLLLLLQPEAVVAVVVEIIAMGNRAKVMQVPVLLQAAPVEIKHQVVSTEEVAVEVLFVPNYLNWANYHKMYTTPMKHTVK
jgi:hypothetical protein